LPKDKPQVPRTPTGLLGDDQFAELSKLSISSGDGGDPADWCVEEGGFLHFSASQSPAAKRLGRRAGRRPYLWRWWRRIAGHVTQNFFCSLSFLFLFFCELSLPSVFSTQPSCEKKNGSRQEGEERSGLESKTSKRKKKKKKKRKKEKKKGAKILNMI